MTIYIVVADYKINSNGYKTLAEAQAFICERLGLTLAEALAICGTPYLNIGNVNGSNYTIHDVIV